MKKIRYWLRNVFGFSGKEISGFSVLTVLVVLAVAAPFLVSLLSTSASDNAADIRKLDSLKVLLDKPGEKEPGTKDNSIAESKTNIVTPFNPNELSAEQWQAIGIPASLAQRIINYRQKGGKFRTKSDLLKIYGFPADVYARLQYFILLPDSLTYTRKDFAKAPAAKEETGRQAVRTEKTILSFDLNKADSTQLIQIKGIGPGLSRRILNYRNKLGGFHDKSQVREVYGLDSAVVNELLKYGFIKNAVVGKIFVNTATVQELDAHPYITPKVATIIVDYRSQHGRYTSLENLYQIRALDKVTLDKLAPYLSFD